ncbi:MAG: hypothetical protein OEV21_01200 [Thermoplasmata archaeon]|nr:hypothetical protein [Thermoplasmata archaeon]
MLYLISSNVKEGRISEYFAWVKKNKKGIQDHAPSGWKYLGTYGSVLGFGRYDVTDIWEINKYGDFDTWRNWKDKVGFQLLTEQQDFFLPGTGEATLLREASDIRVAEPKKPKRSKK